MNSRTQRARRNLGIECLEGRLALSGGLATVAPAAHARGQHAEVEHHKGHHDDPAAYHGTSATKGHDDPAAHHDDPGETGRHGSKDDATSHK